MQLVNIYHLIPRCCEWEPTLSTVQPASLNEQKFTNLKHTLMNKYFFDGKFAKCSIP